MKTLNGILLTSLLALFSELAVADQSKATITFSDLTEKPVTGTIQGGTLELNVTDITRQPEEKDPERLSFSIDVDGLVQQASAAAVLLEANGKVSDLLQLTVTPKGKRGMGIDYFTASGTFISDTEEPGGIDLSSFGYSDDVIKAILAKGIRENGTEQNLVPALVDTTTGNAFSIGDHLTITAASDVPEAPQPFTILLAAGALIFFRITLPTLRSGDRSNLDLEPKR
jgi:hypothetical protein